MAKETKGSSMLDDSIAQSNQDSHLEQEASNNHASINNDVKEPPTPLQPPTSHLRSLTPPALTYSPPSSPTTSDSSSRASSLPPYLDISSLQTSKHATSFPIRNQAKLLRLSTTLSDLHLHIAKAYRTEDQALFNDLQARISNAGAGLATFAEPVVWQKEHSVSRGLNSREMRDVYECMDDGGYYLVQHGRVEDEGTEYEALCGERMRRAREVYGARWGWGDDESDGGVDSDGGVEVDEEADDEATLVTDDDGHGEDDEDEEEEEEDEEEAEEDEETQEPPSATRQNWAQEDRETSPPIYSPASSTMTLDCLYG